jgi:hypothetical protein
MSVGLFVSPYWKLRNVRSHSVVGHLKIDVAAASTSLLPLLKLEAFHVGDKVALPHPPRIGFSIRAEVVFGAMVTIGKNEWVMEDELFVVEEVDHGWSVCHSKIASGCVSLAIEVLMPRVERR